MKSKNSYPIPPEFSDAKLSSLIQIFANKLGYGNTSEDFRLKRFNIYYTFNNTDLFSPKLILETYLDKIQKDEYIRLYDDKILLENVFKQLRNILATYFLDPTKITTDIVDIIKCYSSAEHARTEFKKYYEDSLEKFILNTDLGETYNKPAKTIYTLWLEDLLFYLEYAFNAHAIEYYIDASVLLFESKKAEEETPAKTKTKAKTTKKSKEKAS